MTIYPQQSHCHGRGCYCFYGKSPLDIEDDISVISSVTSWSHPEDDDYQDDYIRMEDKLDEFTDLPPIIQNVIAPFLEPDDDDDVAPTPPPSNTHLYFDEDGAEITEKEYLANQAIEDDDYDDPDDDWAFKVKNITFRHPRATLAYFRFVEIQNETAEDDEKITIPLIKREIAEQMMEHSWITNPTEDNASDALDLIAYIMKHIKPE